MPMAGCHKSRGKYIVTGERENEEVYGAAADVCLGVEEEIDG